MCLCVRRGFEAHIHCFVLNLMLEGGGLGHIFIAYFVLILMAEAVQTAEFWDVVVHSGLHGKL